MLDRVRHGWVDSLSWLLLPRACAWLAFDTLQLQPERSIVATAQTWLRISNEYIAQYTKLPGPAALTFLKARAAHLSRMFFVGRHLFSSLPLAVMQALKSLTSDWQNLSRISWRGEPSSSLAKLRTNQIGAYLLNDTFVDKGWLFLGSTEVVDHVFHRHGWRVWVIK